MKTIAALVLMLATLSIAEAQQPAAPKPAAPQDKPATPAPEPALKVTGVQPATAAGN